MVALAGMLLLHVPEGVVFASVVVDPRHTLYEPVIAAGPAVTVTTATLRHPVASE
jgi:hypothetical protein